MELRHLRYFVVVAEEQNVTRAAERLHVSQPPLSRQIRDLEEELGVELFRRTAKSLALTEAGKIFLIEARAVLLRAEQAVQTVRAMASGDRGQIRVGYAPSLTVELLPRALRLFEDECARIRVTLHDLSTEECVQRLANRKIDVALTVRPSESSMRGLRFIRLKNYQLCCAVPVGHPLVRKRSVSIARLKQERLVGLSREEYPEYHEWLRKLLSLAPPNPSSSRNATARRASSQQSQRAAASRCLQFPEMPGGPRVKLLPITPAQAPLVVGALSARETSPLVERFIAAVKQVA